MASVKTMMENAPRLAYNHYVRYFSDCHFHVMTMNEPNFASFFNSFRDSPAGILSANAALDYIITPQSMKGENMLNALLNTMSTFSRPIGETLMVMEDDLEGAYSSERKHEYAPLLPYIHGGKFHFRSLEADRIIMIPLLMDFSQDQAVLDTIYYRSIAEDRINAYAEATVNGMRDYYSRHPDGLFEFYPFIGIDPRLHSMSFLEKLLDRWINTSHRMHRPHTVPSKPFYGIKLYPPLGFCPWPDDGETLEKHRYLYGFCEKHRVPIITHCDDQGFRGVSAQEAWAYTDPAAWRTVLENYPDLIIDFAHFGKQYTIAAKSNVQSIAQRIRRYPDSQWFLSIIALMMEFDGVYSDVSFSGCSPEFYAQLLNYIRDRKECERERILSRILFGSDFSVNLLKVESYTEFLSIFDRSGFTDEEIEVIGERNALAFLSFSGETAAPLCRRDSIKLPE